MRRFFGLTALVILVTLGLADTASAQCGSGNGLFGLRGRFAARREARAAYGACAEQTAACGSFSRQPARTSCAAPSNATVYPAYSGYVNPGGTTYPPSWQASPTPQAPTPPQVPPPTPIPPPVPPPHHPGGTVLR